MKVINRILCISLLVFAGSKLFAIDIQQITNKDGLSNSSVNTICQDVDGRVWLGTWDGLNVYNGQNMRVYKPESGDPHSISHNVIRNIVSTEHGTLWIATDMGINRMNSIDGTFDRFFTDSPRQNIFSEKSFFVVQDSKHTIFAAVAGLGLFFFDDASNSFQLLAQLDTLQPKSLLVDLDDNIWMLNADGVLYKFILNENEQSRSVLLKIARFSQLVGIESIFYDRQGTMWLYTTARTLYSYRIAEGALHHYPFVMSNVETINTMDFADGWQWWGTPDGLLRVHVATGHVEKVLVGLPVLALCRGTQNMLWVGTDNQGAMAILPPQGKFFSMTNANIPHLGSNAVRAFAEDENGGLWVGTKGNGILCLTPLKNGQMEVVKHFTVHSGLHNNSVYALAKGTQDCIWAGGDGEGLAYIDAQTRQMRTLQVPDSLREVLRLSSIYAVLPQKNVLWIGTSGNGFYKITLEGDREKYTIKEYKNFCFKDSKSLSNNIVYSIVPADEHHLWIGTRGGGLNLFDIRSERFTVIRLSRGNSNLIGRDDILCVYPDEQSAVWIGTSMGLMKLWRNEHGKFMCQCISEQQGLPNNTVHGILEDKEHNLWVSTNKGLSKIIKANGKMRIVSYYRQDGLHNDEFADGAFYRSAHTPFSYFGGIDGFTMFNPTTIDHSNYVPPLWLESFSVNNKEENLTRFLKKKRNNTALQLSYRHNLFGFRFVPLDYMASSKCEIAYRLQGYNKEWVQLGTSGTIVFSNLPAGHYTLYLKWCNADKVWSNRTYTLPIIKRPPWWASLVAWLCYAVILVALAALAWHVRRKQLDARHSIELKELEKQKTEEIHQAKLRFFTNIAHEFSNSLTLIYGPCLQLLQTNDDNVRHYATTIKSSSERMQKLIKQLIEFRKAETGHLKLRIEQIEVGGLLKMVAEGFTEILEQKKIHLEMTCSPNLMWPSDWDCLEKIVFNLLSNAAKYTPENEHITVTTGIVDGFLQIAVTNSGIGILPERRQTLFNRFESLNRFERQVMNGIETSSGIGLSLCQSLAESLHGTIGVDSDGASYTTFTVRIPKNDLTETQPETNARNIEIPQSISTNIPAPSVPLYNPDIDKQGLVMVVDDDKDICTLVTDILSSHYEVVQAANGRQALELMKTRLPAIVISDVLMPEMGGDKLVTVLKQQELTRHIPVILLSSQNTTENHIEGLESGADAYIDKPFHPRHLEALVDRLVHHNQAVLAYGESPYAALEAFDGDIIRKEDKDLMTQIVNYVLEHLADENLNLEAVAMDLNLTKAQLYRKMKDAVDKTPAAFIREIRLNHAKKMLKTSNATVLEIMYACGFNSKAYFYRQFAQKFGCTPKECRMQA